MEKILRSYQGDENYIFVSYAHKDKDLVLSLIHISEPTRLLVVSRMPSSA